MKSLGDVNKKNDVKNQAAEEMKAEPEKIDFSNVKIEPLFEEEVDFDTFSKSDFRAVKVKECVAVPKSKKLLQFTLDDGTDTDRTILSGIHAYYEPEELVGKDNNGYRNYTAQDVETLKKISVYRKLGISIKDIQSLLETGDKSILLRIYQEKVQEKVLKDSELEALKQFIDDGDADKANEALDYQTVENAIESLLPGKEWGDYFKSHFKPFLNVRLKTLEQKQALQNILEYCDETTLKVPFIMGIGAKMIGGIAQETRTADEMIAYYRDMSESEYERLKEKVWKGAKMKNGIMKYHPAFIAQRKMQKELQNKGYNDICKTVDRCHKIMELQ